MTFTTHTSPSATRIPLKNHYWKSSIFIRASLAFQKFSGTYQSLNNLGGTCRFKDKCDGSLLPKGLWKAMIMPSFGLPPSLFPPRVPNISLYFLRSDSNILQNVLFTLVVSIFLLPLNPRAYHLHCSQGGVSLHIF